MAGGDQLQKLGRNKVWAFKERGMAARTRI
jgi:hypothetical protein